VSVEHTDVAAYSFGLLEEQDRLEFESHLAGCESCAAELAELSAMADLFTGVDPVEPEQDEPEGAAIADLMHRRAAASRRRGLQRDFLAAAACLVLVGGGLAAGLTVAPGPAGQAAIAMSGQRHTASNAVTGARATVGLVAKAWGTQVTMDLAGVRGPLKCELVAVSRSGQRRVIAGWLVPQAGYGVAGHPGHLLLMGGTWIMRSDISRIDVNVVGGRTLVSISI